MAIHILGIRHHGPGSARNVKTFLEEIKPDIVLVEGPPEADDILQWVSHEELKPPVAILCYQPDDPQHSSFYPFAEFSPEWQAILYAKKNKIHVRFMDLPVANHFAVEKEEKKEESKEPDANGTDEAKTNNAALLSSDMQLKSSDDKCRNADRKRQHATQQQSNQGTPDGHRDWYNNNSSPGETEEAIENEPTQLIRIDPMFYLAEAAGYNDGEKWWEHMFEHRHNNEEVFNAVNEAMGALLQHL